MKKRLCLLMILTLTMFTILTSCNNGGDSRGLMFASNGDGTCAVIGIGECTDTDVVIPKKSPDGDLVTSIGFGAFQVCTGLTSITIPDSVTRICDMAFANCIGLTSFTIPNSVTSVGMDVFYGCTQLEFTIYDGLRYLGNESDPYRVLIGIDDSTQSTYKICDSTKIIAGHAFPRCTDLISIVIPDSVTSIGTGAFDKCTGLTSITIPAGVTYIGESAFLRCTGLTSLNVSEGNPVYHSEGNCIIETETGTLVVGCKTSQIPDSVTSIGRDAFRECADLTSITIPAGVTSIDYQAFSGCTDLTSITIPVSIKSVDVWAFEGCTNLTDVYFSGSKQEWTAIKIGHKNEPLKKATIHFDYAPEE